MSVLLANTTAGIRRRVESTLNSMGERTQAGWGAISDLLPALIEEGVNGSWLVGVDDSLWPVRQGDLVVAESGQSYLIQSSDLLTNVADDTVNWVRCDGLARHDGTTVPADGWFVGRYADTVDPSDPDPDGEPVQVGGAALWVGSGPPSTTDFAEPGDEYLDSLSGVVYQLGEA